MERVIHSAGHPGIEECPFSSGAGPENPSLYLTDILRGTSEQQAILVQARGRYRGNFWIAGGQATLES